MIDVSKCEFEESFRGENCTVYYFTYPKDLTETEFYSEEDYGNVFCMCISLTVLEDGECCLAMSPAVEEVDCLMDVDWRDLYEGINYQPETILALLNMAKASMSRTVLDLSSLL